MKVSEILAKKGTRVATIRPTASVAQAVARFRTEGVGALVVVGLDANMMGLIAERDIVTALAENGSESLSQPVEEAMNRRPATCTPSDDIKAVMATMTQRRLRHVVVVQSGKLAGIISIGDVVKSRLDEMVLETNLLRDAYIAKP